MSFRILRQVLGKVFFLLVVGFLLSSCSGSRSVMNMSQEDIDKAVNITKATKNLGVTELRLLGLSDMIKYRDPIYGVDWISNFKKEMKEEIYDIKYAKVSSYGTAENACKVAILNSKQAIAAQNGERISGITKAFSQGQSSANKPYIASDITSGVVNYVNSRMIGIRIYDCTMSKSGYMVAATYFDPEGVKKFLSQLELIAKSGKVDFSGATGTNNTIDSNKDALFREIDNYRNSSNPHRSNNNSGGNNPRTNNYRTNGQSGFNNSYTPTYNVVDAPVNMRLGRASNGR